MPQVWVAYSGGVDSHALLHLAVRSGYQVRAIHINDHLSPNANAWQQHCVKICKQLQVPLTCIDVQVKSSSKQSLEDAARIARRQAWLGLLAPQDILMLAHHADDQAETILYRLFRGTGPQGLGGMQQYSKLGAAILFRPFLTISKQAILEYAKQHKLKYINDETNNHINFDRNFIRHKIMPLLAKRWPAVVDNINRAGSLSSQLVDVIQPELSKNLAKICVPNTQQLDLIAWQKFSALWQNELLRAWLIEQGINPSLQQLQLIVQEVVNAKQDAQPKFKIANKYIRRSNDKLYLLDKDAVAEIFSVEWDLINPLQLPNGVVLKRAELPDLACDKVTIKLGVYGPKAKKIFQKHNIPAWERHNYPLVFVDGKLIAIIGLYS